MPPFVGPLKMVSGPGPFDPPVRPVPSFSHPPIDQIVGKLLDEGIDIGGGRRLVDLELGYQPLHEACVVVNPVA